MAKGRLPPFASLPRSTTFSSFSPSSRCSAVAAFFCGFEFFRYQEKKLSVVSVLSAASRTRTERYLCLLRGSRGNAGEGKGTNGEGLGASSFFFNWRRAKKKNGFIPFAFMKGSPRASQGPRNRPLLP